MADSQVKALARSIDAKIQHTSSATGQGVIELFQMIAEDLAPGIMRPKSNDVRHTSDACLADKSTPETVTIAVRQEGEGHTLQSPRRPSKAACCF